MSAKIISGRKWSKVIKDEVKEQVEKMEKPPCLAVVLVGQRTDSATYVRMKKKACEYCGIKSVSKEMPETATEAEIMDVVKKLNEDPSIHGILVQLPLPKHVNEKKVLDLISLSKDVDGFHPLNIGKLAMKGREPEFIPCTPKGCIELLKREGFEISGKHCVVIGRSNIVGVPVSLLMLHENATVTVCHSRTKNIEKHTKEADIIIAACGITELVKGDWIKEGVIIIDVGMNSKKDPSKKRGYRLCGDVDFEECSKKAAAITPVPGGVGPMTIACLMSNVLESSKKIYSKQK